MAGIEDGPNDYDFGLNFNYALWTKETVLTLCNVKWDAQYRNVVRFDSKSELNSYLNSSANPRTNIGNVSYAKPNMPVRIPLPFNRAIEFNYLRASNPVQPVNGGDTQKDYYYFITDVRYVAPNTTELVLQLDVWSSFVYDTTFGNAFVERGHIGVANENQFDNYGRTWLTEPEGFDIGSGYRTVARRDRFVAGTLDHNAPAGTIREGYSIMALSAIDLNGDPGTADNPNRPVAKSSRFSGMVSGAAVYIWETAADFAVFLSQYADKPWITDGILSVSLIPRIRRYVSISQEKDSDTKAYSGDIAMMIPPLRHNMQGNWRENEEILSAIPSRYRAFRKFLTYPYTVIEATTFGDTPIIIKPEEWRNAHATMIERATLMPPNQRVAFTPLHYNAGGALVEDDWNPFDDTTSGGGDDGGEYLDVMTQISSFPMTAVVNDGAIGYLASTVHARNNARSNATWAHTRAVRGAEVGYDNEASARALDVQQGGAQRRFNIEQLNRDNSAASHSRNIDQITGGFLNPIGSLNTAWNAQNERSAAIDNVQASNRLDQATRALQRDTGREVSDRNLDLARFAAKGDYESAIGSINAAVQDAEMIAPSVSGQYGGESLAFVNGAMKLSLRFKMIDRAAMRRIGEHWIRYGYAINSYVQLPTTLHVMTHFTYWKCQNVVIVSANFPEVYRDTLRGILEKGTTVWRNPDRIGNPEGNTPISGVVM